MPATRRGFLRCLGSIGGAAAFDALPNWASASVSRPVSVSHSAQALGTTITITALHAERHLAKQAVQAALDEIALVERIMSLYRPDSQVCELNRTKYLADPHPYLLRVLRHARDLSATSKGAFDVTVQPLWTLFATSKAAGRIPTSEEVAIARDRVDWQQVEIDAEGRFVKLLGEESLVTLNGIAQGFATDCAVAALRQCGIQRALIDVGELATLGNSPDGDLWRVGIQHPRDPDAYLSLAELAGRCLATSGDYASSFSNDFRHHHIFDPRRGWSPTELSSVSVVADSGIMADGLSTALLVMGIEQGSELIHRTPGASALFVRKDGSSCITPSFPRCS